MIKYVIIFILSFIFCLPVLAAPVKGEVPVTPPLLPHNDQIQPNISHNISGNPSQQTDPSYVSPSTSPADTVVENPVVTPSVVANASEKSAGQKAFSWLKIFAGIAAALVALYTLYKGLQGYGSKK